MRALVRIVVVTTAVAAMLALGVPARAENCKGQSGVNYLYCTVVGEGCIAAGPVAVDPVMCD